MLEWLKGLDNKLGKLTKDERVRIFDRFVLLITKFRNGEYELVYGLPEEETEKKCTELEELEVIISYYRDPAIAKMLDDYIKINMIMIPIIKEKSVKSLKSPEFI